MNRTMVLWNITSFCVYIYIIFVARSGRTKSIIVQIGTDEGEGKV